MNFIRNSLPPVFAVASGGGAGYYMARILHSTQYKMITDGPNMDILEKGITIGMGLGMIGGVMLAGLAGAVISGAMMNKTVSDEAKSMIAAVGFMAGLFGGVYYESQQAPSNGVACSGVYPAISCIQVDKPSPRPR